jgi:hypothetical protein
MKLLEGKFVVVAFGRLKEDFTYEYPAMDFLCASRSQYGGSVKGYRALLQLYAEHGRSALNSDLMHEASKAESIYELIKGDLRVFCFFDKGDLVLTNGVVKHGRKADPKAVAFAVSAKAEYLKNNGLLWLPTPR